MAGELRFSSFLSAARSDNLVPRRVPHDDGQGVEIRAVHVVAAAGGVHIAVGFEGEFLQEPDEGRRTGSCGRACAFGWACVLGWARGFG